jgi:hypothetical protein
MSDSGMLIGWDRVAPGDNVAAVELWSEMMVYFKRLHAEGLIERFEPVMLGAHGGTLNGFILVRGAQENLDNMRNSDDFLSLVVKANKTLTGFRVLRAHYGSEVQKIMRIYATL